MQSDGLSKAHLKRRLVAGFGANTFSRFSSLLFQVVAVPIFLTHWGTQLYGAWLLLNAVPSYFSMTDVGFGSVAGNEMTMLAAAGKFDEALAVFQSVWVLTTVVSSTVGAALLAVIWFLPLNAWLHITDLSQHDVRMIILLLGLAILFSMQENLFQAAFRCVGKYPLGTTAKSLIVVATFLGMIAGVLAGLGPVPVALIFAGTMASGTASLWFLLRREVPWVRFGVEQARWKTIRRLFSPAISFMGFPLVNALNLQGVLLVIGYVMGPVAVVIYSTARVISRSAAQAMNLINNSVWPELSAAFGMGDIELARKLHRRSCQLSILLCLTVIFAIFFLGDWIWKIWTAGRVTTDPILLYILLLQMMISAFWFTSAVVPMAINRHQRMAVAMLVACLISLSLAWGLMHIPALGLRGAAIALTFGDLLTALYVLRESLRLLDDSFSAFTASLLDFAPLRRMAKSLVPRPTPQPK